MLTLPNLKSLPIVLTLLVIAISSNLQAAQTTLPIVPDISGFGVDTVAGRGGEIIRVTNLNSWGEGSLAYALFKSGPRTIVFDVSGTIWQDDYIVIEQPYVTVAFQTAPSPGITIAGAGFEIRTHDVFLHHPRIRVGDLDNNAYPGDRDGITLKNGSYNVVVDHCSVSWAVDENISISGPEKSAEEDNIHDVTFSNCIISEGLANSIHPKGEHSKGMLVHDYTENIALIKNIFAHSIARSPSLKGATSSYVANNLIYNPRSWATGINEGVDTGAVIASLIGNQYILGPDSDSDMAPIAIFENTSLDSKIYLKDNHSSNQDSFSYLSFLADNSPLTPETGEWSMVWVRTSSIPQVESPAIDVSDYTPFPVEQVKDNLLITAGSRPLDRDSVDERIVNEIITLSGKIIDSPTDVGGWPELANNTEVAQLPSNPNGDVDMDGYTNLEEWLHYKAVKLEGQNAYYDSKGELVIPAVSVNNSFYDVKFKLVDSSEWIFELSEAISSSNSNTSNASYQTNLLSIPQLYSEYGTLKVELSYQTGSSPMRFKLKKVEHL